MPAFLTGLRRKTVSDAEPYYETALAILAKIFGTEHVEYAITLSSYGGHLNAVKRFDEAARELDRVVTVFQKSWGPEHYRTINAGNKRGRALHALGRSEEALALLIPSAEIIRADDAEANLLKRQQEFTAAFGEEDERTLQIVTALEELYQERSSNAKN